MKNQQTKLLGILVATLGLSASSWATTTLVSYSNGQLSNVVQNSASNFSADVNKMDPNMMFAVTLSSDQANAYPVVPNAACQIVKAYVSSGSSVMILPIAGLSYDIAGTPALNTPFTGVFKWGDICNAMDETTNADCKTSFTGTITFSFDPTCVSGTSPVDGGITLQLNMH